MASLSGEFNFQAFTDAGAPLASGRVYTYTAGTTTKKTAYTDAAGSVAHTYVSDGAGGEYIALNSRGELPSPLFLASGSYDITLKTSAGVTVWTRRAVGNDGDDSVINIEDYGTSSDWASALVAAGAATTGVIFVPPGAHSMSPTAGQVDDVLALLNRIRVDGSVTINLPSGTHALTAQVVVNSPDAQRITVLGATPVSTTATSQVSVSGSAKAYSVIMGVASSSGVSVGDYALVYQDVTGTGDYEAHAGCWEITAVDSGGSNRLTLLNTHHGAAFPTNTLTGGTVKILKTMLQFSGVDGFRFEGGQPLARLDQLAIIGDWDVAAATGTTGAHGIVMSAPVITGGASSNALHNMMGGASVGPSVGVSGWGEQGIAVSGRCVLVANYIASCGNRKRGMYAEGGHIRSKFAICSGNGEDGFIADTTGFIQAASSFACGNGLNGFWSTNNSLIAAASAVAAGNLTNGFEARGITRMAADLATSKNNTSAGFSATDGGMIDADSATASGNGAHGFDAGSGGLIDCDSSTSTSNTGYGYRAQYGSVIRATGATVSGNTTASYLSNNGSVLFESGGGINVLDTPTYSVGQRFYNSTKANYYAIAITSIGDAAWTSGSTSRFVWKADGTFYPSVDGTQAFGRTSERWSNIHTKQVTISPSASETPANNGEIVFQLTSNTELTFKAKGSDGTVRSGSVTLS